MKNILVIVDAQNDFIDGALGSEEAKSRIANISNKIKSFTDGLIITTQDTHQENYLDTAEEAINKDEPVDIIEIDLKECFHKTLQFHFCRI